MDRSKLKLSQNGDVKCSLNCSADDNFAENASWHLFERQVSDLLCHPQVRAMDQFIHHSNITTLEHCLSVAYMSFMLSERFKLNSRAVARGALLHDLYLYDWHIIKPPEGLHGFTHSGIALKNAVGLFDLDQLEKDIISKHMWPLTINPPRYRESFLVCLIDKYCALLEVMHARSKTRLERFKCFVTALSARSICPTGQ